MRLRLLGQKGSPRRAVRGMRTGVVVCCLAAGAATCAIALHPAAAQAQAAQRTIQGKVQMGSGMANGAIVYLKNTKTLEVRTYISTADGSYRFGQLNPDADYTVWAEFQGKKSKEKAVSSFDTKKVFDITLKIDG